MVNHSLSSEPDDNDEIHITCTACSTLIPRSSLKRHWDAKHLHVAPFPPSSLTKRVTLQHDAGIHAAPPRLRGRPHKIQNIFRDSDFSFDIGVDDAEEESPGPRLDEVFENAGT